MLEAQGLAGRQDAQRRGDECECQMAVRSLHDQLRSCTMLNASIIRHAKAPTPKQTRS